MSFAAAPETEQAGGGYPPSLGLEREPFGPGIEEDFYYSETQRAKCLHFLLHLAPYSDVLLLTGEEGSGKSSLVQQFIQRASPTWRICALEAGELDGPRRLLEELAEVFLFDVTDDMEQSLANLRRMLRTLRNSALVPVLIIDEAHRLPLEIFQLLARVVEDASPEDRSLCIILVGEPALEHRLLEAPLHALRARVGHSFDLPPFDARQTAGYVQHRLAVAGAKASAVFDAAALEEIHRRSGGLPGRINTCAREWLRRGTPAGVSGEAGGSADPAHASVPVPLWRRPAVILLAVLLGGVLLFQDAINGWLRGDAPPSLELPAPPPVKPAAPPAASPPRATHDTGPAQAAQTQVAEEAPHPAPAAAAEPSDSPAPAAVGEKDRGKAVAEGPPTPRSPPPGAASAATPVPGEGAASDDASPAPSPEKAPPPAPAPAAAPAPPELLRQEWLRSRDPGHYTLQLVAMDKSKVLALIDRWSLAGEAATFYTKGGLLALVYGDYPGRAAAVEASRSLAQRFGGTRPWARSFASIQARLAPPRPASPQPLARPGSAATDDGSGRARLAGDEEALLRLEPSHYTLQLMAMDLTAVEPRVRRWGMAGRVRYYRTLRGDRELVAVVYGDYADRARARREAADLQRRIPGIRPWVRRVRDVQNAIHAFRAIHR
ncbi:MAG TPA: AAA family ATPase [Gammaproteobacteria bacterium]|nr:AAA family ATPase [Gammaproteobacteria bacterium]